ncbi:hypothetical protein A2U01_0091183, partial [Trifolium medium]|nr:hypothetical protein [Trifolium medium]
PPIADIYHMRYEMLEHVHISEAIQASEAGKLQKLEPELVTWNLLLRTTHRKLQNFRT